MDSPEIDIASDYFAGDDPGDADQPSPPTEARAAFRPRARDGWLGLRVKISSNAAAP